MKPWLRRQLKSKTLEIEMFHEYHNILMVEDNPEDYKTMMRALTRSGIHHPVYRCEDGDEALEFLFKKKTI